MAYRAEKIDRELGIANMVQLKDLRCGLQSRDDFFESLDQQGLAITFDDVRMRTGAGEVNPSEVDISSRFSTGINLNTPFASAAMDTVTESKMAETMARMGGIGVIHYNMTPKEQKREVRRVKLALNGKIENPRTALASETVGDLLKRIDKKGYKFNTFPVLDENGRFAGIMTGDDFEFCHDDKSVLVSDAMTNVKKVITGKEGIDPNKAYQRMKKYKKKTLPILDSDGRVIALYKWSDVKRLKQGNPEHYNLDENGQLIVAAAIPTSEEALTRIDEIGKYLDVAVLDSAHGDSKHSFRILKLIREMYPDLQVVVGNITDLMSARALVEAGADGIKVGQGPGSICTTRIETGIGTAQLTAIYEIAEAIKGSGVPVIADGGIVNPADISIALAGGADCVMMGSKLAGTEESPGEVFTSDTGRRVKTYRGMGSPSALKANPARYKTKGDPEPLSEGVEAVVEYRGSVVKIIGRYVKSLRKSMSYIGSPNIEYHKTKTRFIRVTNAGIKESQPHIYIS